MFPTLTAYGSEKGVFLREHQSRLYGLPSYFWSRWITLLPLNIIMPIVSTCIFYFMVGFQRGADKFWWFALASVLLNNTGVSMGICAACVFDRWVAGWGDG